MYNTCVVITVDCLLRLIFSIKEFHINFAVDLVYLSYFLVDVVIQMPRVGAQCSVDNCY